MTRPEYYGSKYDTIDTRHINGMLQSIAKNGQGDSLKIGDFVGIRYKASRIIKNKDGVIKEDSIDGNRYSNSPLLIEIIPDQYYIQRNRLPIYLRNKIKIDRGLNLALQNLKRNGTKSIENNPVTRVIMPGSMTRSSPYINIIYDFTVTYVKNQDAREVIKKTKNKSVDSDFLPEKELYDHTTGIASPFEEF